MPFKIFSRKEKTSKPALPRYTRVMVNAFQLRGLVVGTETNGFPRVMLDMFGMDSNAVAIHPRYLTILKKQRTLPAELFL